MLLDWRRTSAGFRATHAPFVASVRSEGGQFAAELTPTRSDLEHLYQHSIQPTDRSAMYQAEQMLSKALRELGLRSAIPSRPRPEHDPDGDPCSKCAFPAAWHRGARPSKPEHEADGDPCGKCGLLAKDHRRRARQARMPRVHRTPKPSVNDAPIVAVDGEGQGRGPHLYTYVAAVDENGELRAEARNQFGLTTLEIFEFLFATGAKRLFGFSLGYDFTKWLTDMPDVLVYDLNRYDKRKIVFENGSVGHRAVYWNGYNLNYIRGKFTIRRARWDEELRRPMPYGPTVTIWDVFRFFQSKFVTALLDWQIRTAEELEFMSSMKDAREDFAKLIAEGKITQGQIEQYCKDECRDLGMLVRQLIEAHENVGLRLRSFYGAGSTAVALMTRFGVKQHIAEPPIAMRRAVMCAFFGGRFEISHVGPIEKAIYNYDISSAYPYQSTLLPCLVCGRWERTRGRNLRRRIEGSRLALVRARVRQSRSAPVAWGPLPFRTEDGTILFPRALGSVWVWKEEFTAAEKLFEGTEAIEAWIYEENCEHKPFGQLPETYLERLRIGKEARGLVLKLGMNSVYGKTAQSVGQAPFRSHVWAGVVTSNTRAQLLGAISAAKDPWSILMLATDGVFSSEQLTLPAPKETGTSEAINGKSKPLGGWEEKVFPKGVFFMRPGVYFPLQATKEQLKEVKARGMSKGVLLDNADRILEHWAQHGIDEKFKVEGLQRFCGMRTGVQSRGKANEIKRSEEYGEWIPYPVEVSLTPLPKRERLMPGGRLKTFDYLAGESAAYDKEAITSPETLAHREAEELLSDQADGDFAEGLFQE